LAARQAKILNLDPVRVGRSTPGIAGWITEMAGEKSDHSITRPDVDLFFEKHFISPSAVVDCRCFQP
jgi:hypothetical protein